MYSVTYDLNLNFIIDKPSLILKESEQELIYKGLVIDQKRKVVLKLLFRASEN